AEAGRERAAEPAPEPETTVPANSAEDDYAPARRLASAAAVPPAANTATATSSPGRKLLADYVAEARAALGPDTEISPAWVRQVTDGARSPSAKVAAGPRAEQRTAPATAASAPAVAAEPVTGAESVREAA